MNIIRIIDFFDQDYLNEIKDELISSKQFIPENIRSFLTFEEITDSFDESLRERYGQEKMEFRSIMSSIYISLDLLTFIIENNYWSLINDKSSFLNFLNSLIQEDFETHSKEFSKVEKEKYNYDYSRFLKLYNTYI